MKSILSASMLLCLGVAGCQSRPDKNATSTKPEEPVAQPAPEPAVNDAAPASPDTTKLQVAGLGSCQPSAEVSATVSRLVDLADANEDGTISRSEAEATMNFVVGGAFFRADRNSDGKVTPEEGRELRDEVTSRHPALASLLAQTRQAAGQSPFKSLAQLLDINYGQTLSIDDARRATKDAIDDSFRVADGNKDGKVSREEAVNASWEGARTIGHSVFAAADGNHDGFLTSAEFQGAVDRSVQVVFKTADSNKDDKLSQDEAALAMSKVVHSLAMPNPI